jgi:hypothetical protein
MWQMFKKIQTIFALFALLPLFREFRLGAHFQTAIYLYMHRAEITHLKFARKNGKREEKSTVNFYILFLKNNGKILSVLIQDISRVTKRGCSTF